MTPTPELPTVPTFDLPISALQAPLTAPDVPTAAPGSWTEQPDIRGLCELLEPILSASIARKVRQRRYTP